MTVQKICARARDEGEVREVLGKIWNEPNDAQELIDQLVANNASMFEFERELEVCSDMKERVIAESARALGPGRDPA